MAEKNVEKKADVKPAKAAKKPNIFSRIAKYFRECKSEVKKITWPTTNTVFRNMGIILVVIIVIGLFIFGLDRGLYALLNLIMATSAA